MAKASKLKLTYQTTEGIPVVTLKGRLVQAEVAQLRQQIREIINKHPPYLILNLAHLDFIDAHGLSVFISALKIAEQRKGEVLLLKPMQNVRTMIELIHLQEHFSIYADELAAIAYCTRMVNGE